jgi:hypothetical protein
MIVRFLSGSRENRTTITLRAWVSRHHLPHLCIEDGEATLFIFPAANAKSRDSFSWSGTELVSARPSRVEKMNRHTVSWLASSRIATGREYVPVPSTNAVALAQGGGDPGAGFEIVVWMFPVLGRVPGAAGAGSVDHGSTFSLHDRIAIMSSVFRSSATSMRSSITPSGGVYSLLTHRWIWREFTFKSRPVAFCHKGP